MIYLTFLEENDFHLLQTLKSIKVKDFYIKIKVLNKERLTILPEYIE